MVMELLGPNLMDLMKLVGQRFSLKTTALLGLQMVSILEALHNNDFIHRDIKPENFCMGIEGKTDQVYLIDFGLCKPFRMDGQHISMEDAGGAVPTGQSPEKKEHDDIV